LSEPSLVSNGLHGYEELSFGSGYREELAVSRAFASLTLVVASLGRVRVLRHVCDVACGTGLQVLVSALLNPQIQFVGIDGSKAHVTAAKRLCAQLGLHNAKFALVDLHDQFTYPEKFDLITCAGTFSWVPVDVQSSIFRFIAANLSEQGAAIIHYLTLPSANVEQRLQREIWQHAHHLPTLQSRLTAAREYLSTRIPGVEKLTADESPDALTQVARRLFKTDDRGVPHEFLASPISAYYFRDFARQAESHGLNVVGDAAIPTAEPMSLPAGPIKAMFDQAKNWVERQEVLDMFGGGSGGRYALLGRSPRAEKPQLDSLKKAFFRLSVSDWYVIENDCVHLSVARQLSVSNEIASGLVALQGAYPATLSFGEAFPDVSVGALWPFVAAGVITPFSAAVAVPTAIGLGTLRTFDMARVECEMLHDDLTSFIGLSRPRHRVVESVLLAAVQPQSRQSLIDSAREEIATASRDEFKSDSWRSWWPRQDALDRKFEPPGLNDELPEKLVSRLVRLGYLV
jgi:precorrin-6B methylase 2